jgi:hypothetical protein
LRKWQSLFQTKIKLFQLKPPNITETRQTKTLNFLNFERKKIIWSAFCSKKTCRKTKNCTRLRLSWDGTIVLNGAATIHPVAKWQLTKSQRVHCCVNRHSLWWSLCAILGFACGSKACVMRFRFIIILPDCHLVDCHSDGCQITFWNTRWWMPVSWCQN